jgi:hypothetical protein
MQRGACLLFAAIVVILFTVAVPAQARDVTGWGEIKWGMTAADAIEKYDLKWMGKEKDSGLYCLIPVSRQPIKISGVKFTLSFWVPTKCDSAPLDRTFGMVRSQLAISAPKNNLDYPPVCFFWGHILCADVPPKKFGNNSQTTITLHKIHTKPSHQFTYLFHHNHLHLFHPFTPEKIR